jgi:geranylgeranyl pyrophosphate synthase
MPLNKLISIAKLKTADYSIITPLQFGATLAIAHPKKLDAMKGYGESVGIAFQLIDDVLGMFGEKKTIGKPGISDLREGKQTVLMYYGMQFASVEDRKILQSSFGNQSASNSDLVKVRNILEHSGAKAKVTMMAQEYINNSKSYIPNITKDKKYIDILNEFSQYCIARKK